MNKIISVLGASGSVGSQAIDVAARRGYSVDFISVGSNVGAAERLARELRPMAVAVADERAALSLKTALADTSVSVLCGAEGILEGIARSQSDTVINAITGEAGLLPTLGVIDSGKRLALANKESLVIAGSVVMSRAKERGVQILPVDSEHCAIFQSLKAGAHSEVKSLILTASGGPFYGKSRDELSAVSARDALAHPTWKMGKRITVDSATLMNKGFEVIEAAHLFGVSPERIKVVVHRESILHSAVEYIDNAVIGEFSVPDMRSCVQYAVDYPERCEAVCAPLDLTALGTLSFAAPDTEAFPLLPLAARSAKDGGAMGAVLNAADEVAVGAFLEGRLSFLGISDTVSEVYSRMMGCSDTHSVDGILAAASEARSLARSLIKA